MSKSQQKRICVQSKCAVRDVLRDEIESLTQRNHDLNKKRTKGEINEAYAKTIESQAEIIRKQLMKLNKLEQKTLAKRNKELEVVVEAAKDVLLASHGIFECHHNYMTTRESTLSALEEALSQLGENND